MQVQAMAKQTAERNGKLESVGDIFVQSLKTMKIGKEFKQHLVVYQWQTLVGRDIAAHARAVKLEFKKLFIRTTHPAWAEQLKYMEYDIKQKINSHFGEELVQELIFTGQPGWYIPQENTLYKEDESRHLGKQLKKIQLSDEELAAIRESCSSIEDEAMRGAAVRLGCNVRRMLRYRQKSYWHPCASEGCGSICPPAEEYCYSCKRRMKEEKAAKIQQLLLDMPWAKYGEVLQEISCSQQEFQSQRLILLQRLAGKVDYGDVESIEAKTLVMLYRSLPPEQLSDEVVKKTMSRLRRDVRYVPKQKAGGREAPSKGAGK